MSHLSTLFALAATALVAVPACKQDSSATGETAQQAMGLYAKGFNALIDDPKKMTTEYFDKVPEDGPEPASRIKLFPRHNAAASDIKEAREAFAAAKQAAPASLEALAPAADQALAAIDKVTATFTAAHGYYDAENYKDDGFAKGKELHVQMLAASKELDTALNTLSAGLSTIEDQQAIVELKKYEGAKSYSYWFRFYNMEAKKFLNAAERAETPEQLAALEAAFAPIRAAHEGLTTFAGSKGEQLNAAFKSYVGIASSYHATATKLVRLGKDAKLDPRALGRESEMLVSNYNNLIGLMNSLYQLEAADALK